VRITSDTVADGIRE
jgi:cephalosporin-C deacetylase-like acetyl esterase